MPNSPSAIVVWDNAFDFKKIKTNWDFENILRHETRHVDDYYQGVAFGGQDIRPLVSETFRYHLWELRAVAHELTYVIQNPPLGRFSLDYLLDRLGFFIFSRDTMCPKSDLEQKAASYFIRKTGLEVDIIGNRIRVNYIFEKPEKHFELGFTNLNIDRPCPLR